MEIADRTVLIAVVVAVGAKVADFFLQLMVVRSFVMRMAKGMKRLPGNSYLHYCHKSQVEYGELSFHYCKGIKRFLAIAIKLQLELRVDNALLDVF